MKAFFKIENEPDFLRILGKILLFYCSDNLFAMFNEMYIFWDCKPLQYSGKIDTDFSIEDTDFWIFTLKKWQKRFFLNNIHTKNGKKGNLKITITLE